MGFVLLFVGLLMIVTGMRGTYAQFGSQLASEFQGQNSFTYQMLAIGAIGIAGYIPAVQTISRWLLAFVVLIILLGNKNQTGFITQLQAALKTGPTPPQAIASGGGNAFGSTAPGTGVGTATNPSGGAVTNFGPLGTLNQNPVVPNSPFDNFLSLFGYGSAAGPGTGTTIGTAIAG